MDKNENGRKNKIFLYLKLHLFPLLFLFNDVTKFPPFFLQSWAEQLKFYLQFRNHLTWLLLIGQKSLSLVILYLNKFFLSSSLFPPSKSADDLQSCQCVVNRFQEVLELFILIGQSTDDSAQSFLWNKKTTKKKTVALKSKHVSVFLFLCSTKSVTDGHSGGTEHSSPIPQHSREVKISDSD